MRRRRASYYLFVTSFDAVIRKRLGEGCVAGGLFAERSRCERIRRKRKRRRGRRRYTKAGSFSYSRLRSSLPGLKRIVFPGGIFTSTPVFGFRPIPFLRCLT